MLRTGWTWGEYSEAPDWLVRDMMLLMNAEAEAQKAAQREAERRSR